YILFGVCSLFLCYEEGHAESGGIDVTELYSLSLDELLNMKVVTATKSERKLEEVPASISVVTKDDIHVWGYTSLADVLKHTLGFYVVDDHILPNAGVRGSAGGLFGESSTIKVLIDGNETSFRSTAGHWLGPEFIPMSTIERIEIIRGPVSALYGEDAFMGVVNVITKNGKDVNGANIWAGGSLTSFGKLGYNPDVSVGFAKGPVDGLVAMQITSDDRSGLKLPDTCPVYDTLSTNNALDNENTSVTQDSKVGFAKFTYHYSPDTSYTFTGRLSTIDRDAKFSPWSLGLVGVGTQENPEQPLISLYQTEAALRVYSKLTDSLDLTFNGGYFKGGPTHKDKIEVGSDLYYVDRDFGYQGGKLLLESKWDVTKSLSLILGTGFLYDKENLISDLRILKYDLTNAAAGTVLEDATTRQGTKDFCNGSAFFQTIWTAIENSLSLIGGIRLDSNNIYGEQVSGRAAIVSSPTEKLSLKLLYGNAFKAPSPYLLYAVPFRVGDVIGNPDLKPQYIHTIEGLTTYKLSNSLISTNLAFSILKDKAEFAQQGVNRIAINVAEVKSLSWETEITAWYHKWLKGTLGFEYQYAVRDSGSRGYYSELTGSKNLIYPSYIIRAGASGNIPKLPLNASLSTMFVSSRWSSAINSIENSDLYELGSYLMLDMNITTVGVKLFANRESVFGLTVRNLLNSSTPDPGFGGVDYPLAPLTVLVQWKQEIW
ncbi:MAG: TonB-dependent receptor, partial [Oligoflexia bacterium]|nr:TonB-dependent receptor [Oligoflexia bacterium]